MATFISLCHINLRHMHINILSLPFIEFFRFLPEIKLGEHINTTWLTLPSLSVQVACSKMILTICQLDCVFISYFILLL